MIPTHHPFLRLCRSIAALLLACAVLAGCGQKGDLYIPAGGKPESPSGG